MLIFENVGPRVHNLFQLIFSIESVTFLGETRGRVLRPKMIKCDMGGGGQKYLSFLIVLWELPKFVIENWISFAGNTVQIYYIFALMSIVLEWGHTTHIKKWQRCARRTETNSSSVLLNLLNSNISNKKLSTKK